MSSQQGIRRRSSAADKSPLTEAHRHSTATTTTFASPNDATRTPPLVTSPGMSNIEHDPLEHKDLESKTMPPPPRPQPQAFSTPTRGSRSASTASRHTNKLSLTLPIAPPTPEPSRPSPTQSSVPQTPTDPYDVLATANPSNANDLIIAIAAQERKVLELREELARAEGDLSSLKRQWQSQDTLSRGGHSRAGIMSPPVVVPWDQSSTITGPNSDLDRKKLLLQQQALPSSGRRRVLRGGHTRTLSLLSPPKSTSSFAIPADKSTNDLGAPPVIQRRMTQAEAPSSKRSSWQARAPVLSPGGAGLVEDFKHGLLAFVEDIRQITVGDEPIKGSGVHRQTSLNRGGEAGRRASGDVQTIRPSGSVTRSTTTDLFDVQSSSSTGDIAGDRAQISATRGKPRTLKNKSFSWAPLSFDSVEDSDWSSWESPSPGKSVRWSGSTMSSGGGAQDTTTESSSPSKPRSPQNEGPILPPKLDELLPSMVNKLSPLSPSNLRRTTNRLMDEWEKSIVERPSPSSCNKENAQHGTTT